MRQPLRSLIQFSQMQSKHSDKSEMFKKKRERKTWTWPCFHPANSTVRGNPGLRSLPCSAVGYGGARSRSPHLQPAALVWTSQSVAARFLFQCWATRLHPTCKPAWHPQRSASACCPGCRTPCSMAALSHADRSSGLDTPVNIREITKWWVQGFWFLKTSCGRKIINNLQYNAQIRNQSFWVALICQRLPTFSCNVGRVNHMVVKL